MYLVGTLIRGVGVQCCDVGAKLDFNLTCLTRTFLVDLKHIRDVTSILCFINVSILFLILTCHSNLYT